jgi:hypothetical protein
VTAPAWVPAEVRFTTPDDWVALCLPPTETAVDALVADLLARHPELEPRRNLVTSVLRSLSEASRVAHCVYAGGAFLPLPGGPLPVTLLVNALPLEAAGDPPDLANTAAFGASTGRRHYSTAEVELTCGRAVRAEWLETAQLASTDAAVVSFFTQYFVIPQGSESLLVLTFSSSAVALAGRLNKLFSDIAASLDVVP